MKTFVITSQHDVFEDIYESGEQDKHINGYELKATLQANDWKEAVNNYIGDVIGYNLGVENCEIEDDVLQTSCLVDGANFQPSEQRVKQWQDGQIKLYSNHITIHVQELIPVELV